MTLCIKENIVLLHIAMNNALTMDVTQGATQFRDPKSNCFFGECLPRDVKSQISTRHEINDDVSRGW